MDKCICCEGTGKINCTTCNGEGRVSCSACEGSGREIRICPTCTKGYVSDPRSMYDEPTLKCPDCHGEWQKDAGPCEKCKGSGKVTCASCKGTGKKECCLCKGAGSIDIEAMCKLLIDISSDSYIKIHVDKITADMVQVIQDAADKGIGVAAVVMGLLHDHGLKINGKNVLERNDKKAMEYYRKGAEAGDVLAQGTYGIRLAIETRKEDIEVGYQWLVKAGENGNVESLYQLAVDGYIYGLYEHDRDLVKSLECFKAILNAKDKDSWYQGYISSAEGYVTFLPSIINNDSKAMLALAEWMESNEKYEDRGCGCYDHDYEYWMEQAAKAGNVDAMMKVAKWYWDSNEKIKANEWYGKAECQGDAGTLMRLGDRLRTGDGITKDPSRAFVCLYRAAEQGNTIAIFKLGVMYDAGEYVEKNREHSLELFVRAAKSGNSGALYSVGMHYLNKYKDQAEAKRLLQLAAEKGSKKAKDELAKIPFYVKASTKMPSGIKGVPDKSPLPKFLKKDYEQAVAGKPALVHKRRRSTYGMKLSKVIFGIMWRLVLAVGAGFLFWWWFEGFNKEALPMMWEQIKGIRGGIPKNLSLAMIVSGGTFVALYMLKLILSKVSVIQFLASTIGGVVSAVLILAGHWGIGGWMALAIVCAVSAKFDGKAHESWWRWVLMSIGLCVSGGFGMNGNWIISSVITAFSMGILLKDEK